MSTFFKVTRTELITTKHESCTEMLKDQEASEAETPLKTETEAEGDVFLTGGEVSLLLMVVLVSNHI